MDRGGPVVVSTVAVLLFLLGSVVAAEDGHGGAGHKHAAPHGGVVQTIGGNHAELVVSPTNGAVDLYVLGDEESKAFPIEATDLIAQVQLTGSTDFIAVNLKANPLPGEKAGAASRFSGLSDALKNAKGLEAVVQIPIDGKRQRAKFDWKPGAISAAAHGHGADGPGHEHAEAGATTIRSAVTATPSPREGKLSEVTLKFKSADGKPVTLDQLVEMHTEKIHLLIVDPSLSDYQHIHPSRGAKPGSYVFPWTPRSSGDYIVFSDLVPTATKRQEYSTVSIVVPGGDKPVNKAANREVSIDGLTFKLEFDKPTLKAGEGVAAKVSVTGADGKPFSKLEPVMGAFAHAVAFDEKRANVSHIHPLGREPEKADERGGPILEFHMKFNESGFWKLFVQVQVNGKDVFAPFGLIVEPGEKKAAVAERLNNSLCPITGKGAHSMMAEAHVVYKGIRVELCCDGCDVNFMKEPDASLKKARESAKP